jgi:hypothetical protein
LKGVWAAMLRDEVRQLERFSEDVLPLVPDR